MHKINAQKPSVDSLAEQLNNESDDMFRTVRPSHMRMDATLNEVCAMQCPDVLQILNLREAPADPTGPRLLRCPSIESSLAIQLVTCQFSIT